MTHEENLFIVSLSEILFEDVQDTREHSKDEIIDEVACDGGVLAWSTITADLDEDATKRF